MKEANEAPEKVYLLFNHPYLVDYAKLNKRRCKEEVEYTRTDAFIEKAIGWIDYNNRNGGCNFDGWEKDFVNYMKGD